MALDSYTSPESIEQLSSRLWRRYDQQAFELLAQIREDPRQTEVLIKGTDYLRCEIQLARRPEMIVRLEDFLRRRSRIALVVRHEVIRRCRGADGCLPDPLRRRGPGKVQRVFRRSGAGGRSGAASLRIAAGVADRHPQRADAHDPKRERGGLYA
ncbi:hypothetical protein G3480_04055 [Thiorhodococcus mannitoliphagus]|uniref:Alpha-glycerophosphate oxidase C-terminal domain-containing protein n=1 Tax=Thiorhodococcus mannitoliphagus TaxID=329406 RepID=A0A6P1DUX5_9GAMM|nr:hypothetical protein [Thiorhodococcus mannitoliphagus]